MTHNFDRIVPRQNTHSYKWDQSKKLFGNADILPLWVADMDFESPPAIKKALQDRAAQGIYGYTIRPESYLSAITSWFERRHKWQIDPAWITDSPGIVTSLSLAVELFSEPGSSVIIQSPVYYPFYDVIRMNDRQIAINPLLQNNGRFEIDFDHLEALMRDGAKLMLFCNPHNPGGRVWEHAELQRLGELSLQYNVLIISDEIHCDLTFPGHPFIPFASLSEELAQNSLTLLAPSKTFNLPGLQSSIVVTPNKELKRKLDYRLKTLSLHMTNYFVPDAIQAAYNDSDLWLDELLVYLRGNLTYALEFIAKEIPQIKAMTPEGTYLLWMDCSELKLDVAELKKLMFQKAEVAFSEGSVFGTEGIGYLRINFACPRSILEEALQRFSRAVREE
ncbi:pyridoxal phosphate-dependent aminotransferase [Paenibacillus psychroresistens]|uniref:cysteine-S-conjugate beta-lyase n=1 Tax=Paenibacillus psychroresistens TaxID=1778678 RepID=A0A6B8RIT4_9BACL|nr:MalY/PatB family protein [Paenibacillus psychroresistens]QGQ95767.1 pyridoxal phosphate-dependent aminotransferase [Paenibacillus psychroresistens]